MVGSPAAPSIGRQPASVRAVIAFGLLPAVTTVFATLYVNDLYLRGKQQRSEMHDALIEYVNSSSKLDTERTQQLGKKLDRLQERLDGSK